MIVDHVGQPAQRGSEPDHRGDPARHHADTRRDSAQRLLAIVDRRRGDREGDRAGAARRSRADRRQGPREVPGDRRSRAAVRRRRGGARGAGAAADELGRRVGDARMALGDPADGRTGSPRPWRGTLVGGRRRRASSPACRSTRGRWRRASCSSRIRGERFDGADFAAAAIDAGAGGRRRAARPRTRSAGRQARARSSIEVDDTTVGAAGAGARGAARVGHEGRGDHRQRRQDHDEGSDGGVSRGAVSRDAQPRELQQPHRAAAVAHRADGSGRTIAVVELGMNHAGEISTLVRIAEPDVRVWTNVGEAHLGFFGSVDAIADAKAEILEGATRVDACSSPTPTTTAIAARTRAFRRPRRDVRHRARRRRARRPTSSIAASTARARASTTPRGAFELTTPLVGRGNLANVLAATAVARRVRRAARRDRRARARGCAPRRIAARSSGWRAASRSSTTATTPTRPRRGARSTCSRGDDGARGASRCSARCSSSATAPSALHEDVGRAARGGRRRPADRGRRRRRRARWPTRRSRPACRARSVRYFATSDEAADAVAALVGAGDRRAREGIARRADRSRRGSAEGGARLMLYHLLFSRCSATAARRC